MRDGNFSPLPLKQCFLFHPAFLETLKRYGLNQLDCNVTTNLDVTLGLMTVTSKFVITAIATKLVITAITTKLVVTTITTKRVVSAYF